MNTKTSKLPNRSFYPTSILLVVSLIAHVGVIALITLVATDKPSQTRINSQKQVRASLKSYLIIPLLEPEIIASDKSIQQPEVIRPEIEQVTNKINANSISKEILPTQNMPTKTVTSQRELPLVHPKPEDSRDPSTVSEISQNNTVIIKTTTNVTVNFDPKHGTLIRNHLAGYHANYSRLQAQAHRMLKTSPIIDTSYSENSTDSILQRPVLNIDCTNTGNKILASISTFTQGTLNCYTNNEFQYYINKRMNPHTNIAPEIAPQD